MSFAPSIEPAAFDIPDSFQAPVSSRPGLSGLLQSAALVPLNERGWLGVTGEDRVRWLNGMATNSIQALTPGEGCYNFFLNAQGRIQGDATAFLLENRLLLETGREQVASLRKLLDHFIIMDDVELEDVSAQWTGVLLAGPAATDLLQAVRLDVHALAPMRRGEFAWQDGQNVAIVHAPSPVVPRFELWSDAETITALSVALEQAGAARADLATLEQLRILEGTPRFGLDLRDKDLPQETAQTRALHFSKGCYLGQEIVERIRSRGSVHRTFSGFVLEGALPAVGTMLTSVEAPDKSIGELTSVTCIELPGAPRQQLGLGYLRREVLERVSRIEYPGGSAIASALPFAVALTQS